MKLTDIMSNMNLDVYPVVALILFLVAFLLIVWGVMRTPKAYNDHQAHLPLEDDFGMSNESTQDNKGVSHG
jgi:cbb3-type cytochrome oxidase subunit 3